MASSCISPAIRAQLRIENAFSNNDTFLSSSIMPPYRHFLSLFALPLWLAFLPLKQQKHQTNWHNFSSICVLCCKRHVAAAIISISQQQPQQLTSLAAKATFNIQRSMFNSLFCYCWYCCCRFVAGCAIFNINCAQLPQNVLLEHQFLHTLFVGKVSLKTARFCEFKVLGIQVPGKLLTFED